MECINLYPHVRRNPASSVEYIHWGPPGQAYSSEWKKELYNITEDRSSWPLAATVTFEMAEESLIEFVKERRVTVSAIVGSVGNHLSERFNYHKKQKLLRFLFRWNSGTFHRHEHAERL